MLLLFVSFYRPQLNLLFLIISADQPFAAVVGEGCVLPSWKVNVSLYFNPLPLAAAGHGSHRPDRFHFKSETVRKLVSSERYLSSETVTIM